MTRRRNSPPDLPPFRLMAPGDLKPHPNNPRTHPADQIAAIARSIREFGFTLPVLISSDNVILAGHGRVLAAQAIGMDEVPVIELGHLTEAQRRAYVIADNALAERSGWNEGLLKLELGALQGLGFDLSLTGFSDLQITGFLAGAGEPSAESAGAGNLAEKFGVPPFSVLNAREGWWQDRKRAWLALGIQSELGRGNTETNTPYERGKEGAADAMAARATANRTRKPNAIPGGAPMPLDRQAKPSQAKPSSNATPGGSKMPAADYSKRQRGDGRGRAI